MQILKPSIHGLHIMVLCCIFVKKKRSKHDFVKFESIVLTNYTVQKENDSFGKVVPEHRTGSSETGLTVGPLSGHS